MKKILIIILIFATFFSIAACDKEKTNAGLNTFLSISESKTELVDTLTWEPAGKSASYRLYASADGGEYEVIYEGGELEYRFGAELGVEYSFKVVPFHEKKNKEIMGADSNIVKSIIGLDAPMILSLSGDGGSVSVKIGTVVNAKVYAIYRSTDNASFEKIGETVSSASKDTQVTSQGEAIIYTDSSVEAGNTYYYEAVALSGGVSGEKSAPKSITIEKKPETSNDAKNTDEKKPETSPPFEISDEMTALITEVYDRYYKTMAELKVYSGSDLFTTENYGYLFDTTLKYLVTTRRMSSNDLTLKKYSYNLTYKPIAYSDGIYTIEVREDSKLNFSFISDITSEQHNLKCIFYIEKADDEYKLVKIDKEEGFAMNLYNSYDGSSDYKAKIDAAYDACLETYTNEFNKLNADREDVNAGKVTYVPNVCDIAYDREKAVAYAHTYWKKRNSAFKIFKANCQNYVSQCIHAGGIEFDTAGGKNKTWYMLNTEKYSFSFSAIGYFKKYLANNVGAGMVLQQDVNLYLAEPGDIILVGSVNKNTPSHTILVVDVIKDTKGNVIDILINGNTNDQHNYPISAAAYPYRVLLKVDGYNTK